MESQQEYLVNTKFPQGSILVCTLFWLDINDLPDVIGNIAVSVIRCLICDNN